MLDKLFKCLRFPVEMVKSRIIELTSVSTILHAGFVHLNCWMFGAMKLGNVVEDSGER